MTDEGIKVEDDVGMCVVVHEYFSDIFTVSNSVSSNVACASPQLISHEQNHKLVEDVTFDEFTEAVLQMHPDKTSGPDGLNPAFYQSFWKVMGKEVFDCCRYWHKEKQSDFVPNRSITNNVIVAFEVVHHMRRGRSGKDGEVALKLDISKAYNKIGWIMRCVSTVSYDINLNGLIVGPITPKRGLYQGDPLSPYLFLFCVEGLSNFLDNAEFDGKIHGWYYLCLRGDFIRNKPKYVLGIASGKLGAERSRKRERINKFSSEVLGARSTWMGGRSGSWAPAQDCWAAAQGRELKFSFLELDFCGTSDF
ncbi:hypothetical protein AgCh_000828 [Apium graveolens]